MEKKNAKERGGKGYQKKKKIVQTTRCHVESEKKNRREDSTHFKLLRLKIKKKSSKIRVWQRGPTNFFFKKKAN